MDYKKTETEILEATKEFARFHNIHCDDLTETLILNAMRELSELPTHAIGDGWVVHKLQINSLSIQK